MPKFEDFIKGFEVDPIIEKARKLIELGEEPFGTHKFFYEKDGKFYSSGFSQEDEEVSPNDMAKAYDEYIASQKE